MAEPMSYVAALRLMSSQKRSVAEDHECRHPGNLLTRRTRVGGRTHRQGAHHYATCSEPNADERPCDEIDSHHVFQDEWHSRRPRAV